MSKIVFALMIFITSSLVTPLVNAADYQIEQLSDQLYRFVDDRHRAIFLVTEEGILLVDTLNPSAATWLKRELQQRFKQPVRYLVFSHNHSDHIYGAQQFISPQTQFVAHELAAQDIAVTKANTVIPNLTFTDKMALTLGDQTIELRYHGPSDGRGSISTLFKDQKVLFVVDWIVLGRMPWQKLWSYDIQGMINATREVLKLDFDTFVGGHGNIGTKADVADYLNYLDDLYTAVINGIHAGKTLDELKQSIKLDKYQDLQHYQAWLPLNIEGVYERLMEESGMGWRPDID